MLDKRSYITALVAAVRAQEDELDLRPREHQQAFAEALRVGIETYLRETEKLNDNR